MGKGAWLYLLRSHLIEAAFPALTASNYQITSPASPDYNCLAWAASTDNKWWWPDNQNTAYWPLEAPREETVDAFVKAYSLAGYSPCNDSHYERGVEKIAIYLSADGKPTHAARQLPSGRWTSKLGEREDIEHETLSDIAGQHYGNVAVIMRRPNSNFP